MLCPLPSVPPPLSHPPLYLRPSSPVPLRGRPPHSGYPDVVCTGDSSGSIVVFNGVVQTEDEFLDPPTVVLFDACAEGSNGSVPVPAALNGIPADTYPNSPHAAVVLWCSPVNASSPSLVRILAVLPGGSTDLVTVVQEETITALAVGDVDPDLAGPEIVVATGPGALIVFSPAGGSWAPVASILTGALGDVWASVAQLADLNNDGRYSH